MAKFNIGDREFRCKADAQSHVQGILRSAPIGVPISNSVLVDLLSRHPDSEEKLGSGLGHFEVRYDDRGTRCFVHVDSSGRRIVFSYRVCFQPKLAGLDSTVRQVLRHAIEDQVSPLRRPGFEVDHVNEGGFAGLARRFLDHVGGPEKVLVRRREDQFGSEMADEGQIVLWQEFHRRYARYEVVTTEEHRARTAARRVEKEGNA